MAYLFDQGLRLQIISGRGLVPLDRKTSDPYVTVSYDDDEVLAKTRMIEDNLNPEWNEWLELPRPPPGSFLIRFTIWDADIGKDDCMGMAELKLAEGIIGYHDLNVIPKPNTKTFEKLQELDSLGQLRVQVRDPSDSQPMQSDRRSSSSGYASRPAVETVAQDTITPTQQYSVTQPAHIPVADDTDDSSLTMGSVEFTLVRATGLAATDRTAADPYVAIQFDGQEDYAAKSKVIHKTLKPEWNQSFNFPITPLDQYLVMKFTVLDEDVNSADDFMGMAFLPIGLGMDGLHKLTLLPRPGHWADRALMKKNGGSLGILEISVKSRLDKSHLPMHQSGFESLDVEVLDASGLSLCTGDPFVSLAFGKRNAVAKTTTHSTSKNPVWNETFHLVVPPEESALRVCVYDFFSHNSAEELLGEARILIKGNCLGEHELVLSCKGKDVRQNMGRVRVRVRGTRIYNYQDDIEYEDKESERQESIVHGVEASIPKTQPMSATITAENEEERIHKMAELWRGHEATETVFVAYPLSGEVKEAGDAAKRAAYEEHRQLQEETERLRLLHEQQAYELAVQRAQFERQQEEDERKRAVERKRLEDLASYERISLKLGGGHHFAGEVVLVPHAPGSPMSHHMGRTSPKLQGPHGPLGSRLEYKSPYAQQPFYKPKPKAKPKAATKRSKTKKGPTPIPPIISYAPKRKTDGPQPVLLRGLVPLNQPSYCKTDFYSDDKRSIGKRKLQGVSFDKMSTASRVPIQIPDA